MDEINLKMLNFTKVMAMKPMLTVKGMNGMKPIKYFKSVSDSSSIE